VYHILLVTGGKGKFVIGKTEVPVESGQLFITSPGEWHSFTNAIGENVEYCEATFEFKNRAGVVLTIPFHQVLSAWTGKRCQPISRTTVSAELHGIIMSEIERMARIGHSQQPDFELYLNESLARLFLALYSHLYRPQSAEPKIDPLQAVQQYVHKHFNEQLSLAQLAKLSGFTSNYISRSFKSRYGAAPIVYQHRLRIQAASNLLLTTEHPIKKIADLVGFNDVYFFSRAFKKHTGTPPGRFRNVSI
jgi:AraC-like DNA-binding protein